MTSPPNIASLFCLSREICELVVGMTRVQMYSKFTVLFLDEQVTVFLK